MFEVNAVHARHREVGYDQLNLRGVFAKEFNRLLSVFRCKDLVVSFFEGDANQSSKGGFVLDDKYGCRSRLCDGTDCGNTRFFSYFLDSMSRKLRSWGKRV